MTTQPRILLDSVGDAAVPEDYVLVQTEVDFLRRAAEAQPLMLRGERLCRWGQDFYRARGVATRRVQSPTRELQSILPDLADTDAQIIIQRIGAMRFAQLSRPLTPLTLLETLYPSRLWMDFPSVQHAAEWLLWLHQNEPDQATQTLIRPILQQWYNTATVPERQAYVAADGEQARVLVHEWLHITPQERTTDMGTFPLEVPRELVTTARHAWAAQITDSQGAFADKLLGGQGIPRSLLLVAAEESAAYYGKNPSHLTQARFETLAPFLNSEAQAGLRKFIPQPSPGAPPETIAEILAWFESAYLPYRLWQVRFGDEQAMAIAEEASRLFAKWYLDEYPKGLMGGPLHDHLSFYQTIVSKQNERTATVVIILDGLHAEDARQLIFELQQNVPRLALLEQRWVFAPVPTVTEFAKDALLKGYDPGTAKDESAQAPVLPERIDPTHQLMKAKPGDVLVWRVMEPDTTYHKRNTYDFLPRAVEAALRQITMTIGDIVRNVPDELPLRIVITTDHGRLLGRANRTVPVPKGMQAHGRAAWGKRTHAFNESGIIYENDVAFLHGERFGLPANAAETAVLIGPGMFKTNDNRSGTEVFPHGGASPEEVVIPWMVLERDWVTPDIQINMHGEGISGQRGQARIGVTNPTDIPIVIGRIAWRLAGQEDRIIELKLHVKARSSAEMEIMVDSWPTAHQAQHVTAVATTYMPAGRQYDVPISSVALQTKEMYQRDDDILGDLT